jgi:hypothetical protein
VIVTEVEARGLWCPWSRVRFGNVAVNRNNQETTDRPFVGNARCLASRCMAWRWVGDRGEEGYCGAAGMPVFLRRLRSERGDHG